MGTGDGGGGPRHEVEVRPGRPFWATRAVFLGKVGTVAILSSSCALIGERKFCPYESIAYLRICICIRAIELYRNLDAISSGHMPLKAFFNKKIYHNRAAA